MNLQKKTVFKLCFVSWIICMFFGFWADARYGIDLIYHLGTAYLIGAMFSMSQP